MEFLSFSKGILTDPEPQFRKLFNGDLKPGTSIIIYIFYIFANAFFLTAKPTDFPAEFAQFGLEAKSWAFYFFVEIGLGTAITAAVSALMLHFLRIFRAGKLFIKIPAWTLGMLACAGTAYYAKTAPFSLLLSIGAFFFIAVIIRREQMVYWRFFQAALALNLITVVVLPLEFAAVYLRSENLFLAAEMIAGLWILVLFTKLAKIFTGTSVPKAVISLGAGSLAGLLLLYLLYGAGVIPKEIYKALLIL